MTRDKPAFLCEAKRIGGLAPSLLLRGAAAVALLVLATPAAAQQVEALADGGYIHAAAEQAVAVPVNEAIRVDGRLDEPAWQEAAAVTRFTQRDPEEGAPVSQRTEVRILYDDESLYIGVRLEDTVRVTTRLGRRDMDLLDSDWFGVTLDSYHDHRTGFRFQVNPGGVQRDAMVRMGSGGEVEDLSWDPVWEVVTAVDERGWTVEMRIPFSQLRFRPAEAQTWGIQLERIIGRRGEVAHFAFVPKTDVGGVPRYGHLVGLRGIEPGRRLEILPYVVARSEHVDRESNPFRGSSEYGGDAGADLLYRLTPDLTLNVTVNPDFGQVEVDPAIVNLGVYEVFLPERRPFFVEGNEIFNFTGNTSGGQLFYSRRIGRRPQLRPPTQAADLPDATRILGAGKLSGRTGQGWAVGVLNAVTAPADARYLDGDGDARTMTVEPLTNYFVGRARRDAAEGRTSFGAALTSVVRDVSAPEPAGALHSSAWAGGLDFRHEWDERRWQLTGSVAGSHVRGSAAAITATQRMPHHYFQRPDAAHVSVDSAATSLSGYSTGLTLVRQAGQHWRGSIAAAATSPGYEVNDLGFAMRTDRIDLSGSVTYQQTQPGDFLRDWSVTAQVRRETNFDHDPILRFVVLAGEARHLDFWRVTTHALHRWETVDDRSTRGGPLIVRPAERMAGFNLHSDPRQSVSGRIGAGVVRGDYDGRAWEAAGSVQLRTSPRWNLSLGPYVSRGRIPAQYVSTVVDPEAEATFGRRYLFAPLDFTHVNLSARLNVTLAPRVTVELFAQPLIFAADYGEIGSLVAPRTFDFRPFDGQAPQLDHTLRSFRGNAVLRWEWRPGSTLYLAWQRDRRDIDPDGSFTFTDDVRALFSGRSENILVLKATYWLNP